MPTNDFVTALGQLLSEPSLRVALRNDPAATARDLSLSEYDSTALIALDPEQLEAHANTLLGKRIFEVRRLLPETFRAMGDTARPTLFEYAQSHWPQGHHRHIEDGLSFCRYLQERKSEQVNRAEFNRVRFVVSERRFAAHLVADYVVQTRARTALQILWRDRRGHPRENVIYARVLPIPWFGRH